ncbi:MAG TPA: hypothetical protein VGK52_08895 [Polyangia bacterium]
MHTRFGAWHLQTCATHASPALHEVPHAPHLPKLLARFTPFWPHLVSPAAHPVWQMPALQN